MPESIFTFEQLLEFLRSFNCDGSCNDHQSDVCAHEFKYICPRCEQAQQVTPEDQGVLQLVNGLCEACIADVSKGEDFDFEWQSTPATKCGQQGVPHKMKRISPMKTICINPGCNAFL